MAHRSDQGLLQRIFGGSPRDPVTVRVSELLIGKDALIPENAQLLLNRIAALTSAGSRIVLDFTDVRVVSSGFANAFFLGLAKIRSLDQWREVLDLINTTDLQQEILTRSLQAARHATSREKGKPS